MRILGGTFKRGWLLAAWEPDAFYGIIIGPWAIGFTRYRRKP